MAVATPVDEGLVRKIVDDLANRAQRLFIDGRWIEARSGTTFPTLNPATEDVLAHVAHGGPEDVELAVRAARRAFDPGSEWRSMTPGDRAKVIWRIGELIEANAEELAILESLDHGKPITAARGYDIPSSRDQFLYMSGWATKIRGATFEVHPPYLPGTEYHAFTRKEPIGVCGQITPWNFPLQMAAWKIAPALAAGCTVILKPAEQTPMTAIRLVELCEEAGVPAGVVNLVTGLGDCGAALASHPQVDKVAFTGSTEVGKRLAKASGDTNLKKLTLELGGKSPQIVLDDADVDAAILGCALPVFYNTGQMCTSGSRMFVHERVYDEVVEGITRYAAGLRIGPGIDPATTLGPLVSPEHFQRVSGYISSGLSQGATTVGGGARSGTRGFFVEPTVFVDTEPDMTIRREEIFGPVATVIRFGDDDDIVAQANDTIYGLAAGIWSRDGKRALRIAKLVNAGQVWINCYNVFDAPMPFGGYKQSGWGRECGEEVVENYLHTKSVCMSLD
jgi:phenylacetaldehyde dehydrogenase